MSERAPLRWNIIACALVFNYLLRRLHKDGLSIQGYADHLVVTVTDKQALGYH